MALTVFNDELNDAWTLRMLHRLTSTSKSEQDDWHV
jgi:hypothetical protein